MLTKTIDYLDAFSRFKKKENVEAVERLLSAHKEFHKFERAQLGKPSYTSIPNQEALNPIVDGTLYCNPENQAPNCTNHKSMEQSGEG